MHRYARAVGKIDGRGRGAETQGSERTRVAVGHDLYRPLVRGEPLDQSKAVLAYRAIDRSVLGCNGLGLTPRGIGASTGRQRQDRAPATVECPSQVDRGRPRFQQQRVCRGKVRVGWILRNREGQSVSGGRSYQWRTA